MTWQKPRGVNRRAIGADLSPRVRPPGCEAGGPLFPVIVITVLRERQGAGGVAFWPTGAGAS
jgi:hypothetical protein